MFKSWLELFQYMNLSTLILLVSSFALLILSTIFHVRNSKKAVFLLFLSALCVSSTFALLDPFLNLWDEQFHALVAKNLTNNFFQPQLQADSPIPLDHTNWSNNEIWLHKPPLALWQMAWSIKIFGTHCFALRLPMVLMHALLVFPIYRMGCIVWNKSTGFYAAALFSFLYYPLDLVSGYYTSEHIDLTFLFYITCSLWAWLEFRNNHKTRWIIWVGIFAGLAVLTKWLVGLLVFAGVFTTLFLLKENRTNAQLWRKVLLALGLSVLVVLPWHIYAYLTFPVEYSFEMQFNTRHFTEVIENHPGDALYYWKNLSTLYGTAFLIPYFILLSVVASFKTIRKREHLLFALAVLLAPYLFFSLAKTKMPSFLVVVSPLVILICVGFVQFLLEKMKNRLPYIHEKPWIQVLVIIVMTLSVLSPHRIIGTHYKSAEVRVNAIERTQFIKNQQFSTDQKAIVLINDENAIPYEYIHWMYYHDNVNAYPFLPEDIAWVNLEGFALYQVIDGQLIMLSNNK